MKPAKAILCCAVVLGFIPDRWSLGITTCPRTPAGVREFAAGQAHGKADPMNRIPGDADDCDQTGFDQHPFCP